MNNVEQLLKDLSEHYDDMSDREREFIESVSEAVFKNHRRALSRKEEHQILNLWNRTCA